MTRGSDDGRKTIDAVHTSFGVLHALAELDGAGVTELATHLGATKGTVYNHLATLRDEEYVVKTDDDRYHVGLRFLDLAHHATSRVAIYDIVSTEVDKLAEESGELALFTVEEHGKGVCLYVAAGERAVQTEVYVGYRSELHITAVGKAILAHLPEERVDAIIGDGELPAETDRTITDPDALREELAGIRERGIAFNREEKIQGLIGVGAPIVTGDGVAGAISVIGPVKRIGQDDVRSELADLVMRSANIIEINATST